MQSRFQDVEHLLRLAGIFACGLLLFIVIRWLLVPDDFGVYGHYRAGALADNRQPAPAFAGADACAECHDDVVAARVGGGHEGIRCEACHGALARHAADPVALVPERPDAATLCVRCHLSAVARPATFPQVDPIEHADGDPCDDCHLPHAPGFEEE